MQSRPLASHWIALALLSLLVLIGALAAHVSSVQKAAVIPLTAGRTLQLSAFRIFPHAVRLSVVFDRAQDQERPELGAFVTKSGSGYLEFESPGEPVIFEVRGPVSAARYEALPATAHDARHIHRDLVVRDTDGNAHRFAWPPDDAGRPVLPAGGSTVDLTVVAAGGTLGGEVVTVILEPPLSFKSAATGYGFLWWFFFWPIMAIPLACYGACLVRKTWHARSGLRP